MATMALRPMSVGELLDRSFQVYRRHFGTLFLTTASGFLVIALVYGLAGVPMGMMDHPGAYPGLTLLLLIPLFLMTLAVWGALAYQVSRAVTGGPVTVRDGMKRGAAAILSLIGFGLLAYLLMFGVLIPAIVAGGLASAFGTAGVIVGVIVGGGLALYALIWWAAIVFIAVPALIVERLGPLRALKRARTLSKGGRLRLVAVAVVAWIAVMLPVLGAYMVIGTASALWDPQAFETMSSTQLVLQQLIAFASSAFTTPFLVAVSVLAYYDRRVRREGLDVDLASQALTASG